MFGDARWWFSGFGMGFFGWFSVVCCVNGGGSWCFVGFVVVVLMYLKK